MKKLALTIAAALALTGCTATGGTAFDARSGAKVGTKEFAAFCAERDYKGGIANTAGTFADILVPVGIVGVLTGGGKEALKGNKTTAALNEKCEIHEALVQ